MLFFFRTKWQSASMCSVHYDGFKGVFLVSKLANRCFIGRLSTTPLSIKIFSHNWCRSDEDQEDNIIVTAQALTFLEVFDGTHGPIPMFRGFEPLWDPKQSLKPAVCRLVFAEQPFIGMSVEPISYGPIEGPCLGLSDQNQVHQVHIE